MIQDILLKKSKNEMRESALEERAGLEAAFGEWAAERATRHALALIEQFPDAVVSGYHPFGSEIDCLPLLEALAEAGHATCLPVVVEKGAPLVFRRWRPGDATVAGVHGIPVPPESAEVVAPDLLIVPLLAFDMRGYRLGYGGGFYDRTLASLRAEREVTAVGFAFAGQEVEEVPEGPQDQPLDWIITEGGARAFGE